LLSLTNIWSLQIARRQLPEVSSYPLIDFAFKATKVASDQPLSQGDLPVTFTADDADIRAAVKNVKITTILTGSRPELQPRVAPVMAQMRGVQNATRSSPAKDVPTVHYP
jgi:hypothetical protein